MPMPMPTPRSLLLAAAVLASLSACGGDDDGVSPIPYQDDGKLTVMTRNLYLGADLTPVIAAGTDPVAFVYATTAVWNQVNVNRFDLRAEAIADEVLASLPDVIGLQEVSLWRTQTPGDSQGARTAATTVAIDYLALLQGALRARGLSYVAAQELELFDFEVPISTGQDVRLTDRQVILVREGIPYVASESDKGIFEALMSLPVLGVQLPVARGWTKVQVTVGAEDVDVYDTHLEAFSDQARDAQATELAGILAGESGRVALVGDLNATDAEGAYATFAPGAGFTDAWAAAGTGDGLTCCWPADLRQTTPGLTARIDHVLARGGTGQLVPESATVVGEVEADRSSGLWPSDHAGVVVRLAP